MPGGCSAASSRGPRPGRQRALGRPPWGASLDHLGVGVQAYPVDGSHNRC
jgi:hypothetical protein